MDDINSFVSTELLEDIFAQLKSSNLTQLLRRKYKKDEFVYYDISYRSYGSHSFILLRNAFECYCSSQQEIILLCRYLEVEQAVTHYAVELFDKFYTNLIANGRKVGLLNDLSYSIELTPQFGVNIWNLKNLKLRYNRLYLQLVSSAKFAEYARSICMVMCIFIASKQFECQHLQLSKVKNFLYSRDVPLEWIQRRFLASLEIKILNLVNFELNITPLKTYAETIMLILARFLQRTRFAQYFANEKVNQMQSIAAILVENYYMLQVPFLLKLFQVFNNREFNFYLIDDVDDVENIARDKLLIAAAIVGATCTLYFTENIDNMPILRYISYICEIELLRVERGCNAVLHFLFRGPLEQNKRSQSINSLFSFNA